MPARQETRLLLRSEAQKGRSMVHSLTVHSFTPFLTDSRYPYLRRAYLGNVSTNELVAGDRRRALIVDDMLDVTEMLSVLLTHAGYDVVTAASAPAALAAAQTRDFDVVISDIGMPEMNGYELAKALRALPNYQNVPLVAVTGYSMFDDRERSLNSGFNAHVTKPIDPRALLDLIEKL